ncbi:MAG: tetratricopeptide repeat protein [Chlorobiaceae bacterium]|nr:tetratricopeptide repeat protein [Chlorobiaceae bacterium]
MTDREPFEPVVSGNHSEPEGDYRLALECIDNGEYEKALAILDSLAGPASRDSRIRYARAVANLSIGEYRKAGTDLLFTVVLDRSFLPAYRHLGYVFLTMGREESAVKILEAALRIDPEYVEALCVLGDVYMDLGKSEQSLEAFEKALRLNPANPEPHCKLAMYYLSRGDMAGLRAEFEVLKDLEPSVAAQIAELLL